MIVDRARGVRIGAHAEEVVFADLDHVRDFVEDFRDFVVLHRLTPSPIHIARPLFPSQSHHTARNQPKPGLGEATDGC